MAFLNKLAAGGGPEPPPDIREKLMNKLRELEVE